MNCYLLLIYTRLIDCNEWRTEKRIEWTNMWKEIRLKFMMATYVT